MMPDDISAMRALRARVAAVIDAVHPGLGEELDDDASLIKSGRLDSLALFNLTSLIESEVGHSIDLTSFDLANEWDTIGGIVRFTQRQRAKR